VGKKLQIRIRFAFENGFHQWVASIHNGDGDRCLVHIRPNVLGIIHQKLSEAIRFIGTILC